MTDSGSLGGDSSRNKGPPMTAFSTLRQDKVWRELSKNSSLFHQQEREDRCYHDFGRHLPEFDHTTVLLNHGEHAVAAALKKLNRNHQGNHRYNQVLQDVDEFPIGEIFVEREDGVVFAKLRNRQSPSQLLSAKYSTNPQSEQNLFREAYFLSKLKHTNILTFRGCFDKYFIMGGIPITLGRLISTAWKKNASVSSFSSRQQQQLSKRLHDVAIPIVRALQHVHSHRLLYRSLSRDTVAMVLLTRDGGGGGGSNSGNPHNYNAHSNPGVVQLINFEMAREMKEGEGQLGKYQLTAMVGDWKYMAKEVAKGWRYNESADSYSFGILLWELVCGTLAYEGYSKDTDFVSKIIEREERPPIPTAGWMPKKLVQLLRNCFSWNSHQRPSLETIGLELEGIVQSLDQQQHQQPSSSSSSSSSGGGSQNEAPNDETSLRSALSSVLIRANPQKKL